ncbi:MAG: hypothetical protein GYB31_17050 [Bacteroidetes bacterium]|nr:hypothetical protein [Bacteroidota bacterium]
MGSKFIRLFGQILFFIGAIVVFVPNETSLHEFLQWTFVVGCILMFSAKAKEKNQNKIIQENG